MNKKPILLGKLSGGGGGISKKESSFGQPGCSSPIYDFKLYNYFRIK
jgi:hypothetical protein